MDHITHEMRMANWKPIVEACHARPKGQSAKQWLAQNNINEKQFYYWQRRLREEAYFCQNSESLPEISSASDLSFTEISLDNVTQSPKTSFVPDAVIRQGRVSIELSNTISDQLLAKLLGGLAHAQ